MHLRVLQRRRQTVFGNEMFFRNKESGASTGFPLGRTLKALRGSIELRCDKWRGRVFRRRRRLRYQAIPKLNGVPPNGDGGHEKENPSGNKRDSIVMRLNPFGLRHA